MQGTRGAVGAPTIVGPSRPEGVKRFVRFLVVGAAGFAADAAVLWLALQTAPQMGPFLARLCSVGVAVLLTWTLNRCFAFGPSSRGLAAEGARYGGVSLAASLVNYGAFSATLLLWPECPPLLALVAGSLVAIAFSFTGYSRLVFDR